MSRSLLGGYWTLERGREGEIGREEERRGEERRGEERRGEERRGDETRRDETRDKLKTQFPAPIAC